MSFESALFLFIVGFIGIGLGIFGNLPDIWPLVSVGIGLGAWFISAIWGFIDRTFLAIHHLKQSRKIDEEYKIEKSQEDQQVVQRGSSEAKKRAASKRVSLWLDTIFGIRN